MKKVLTIAGSDPSGGAGIQADIKTISMLGAYATSVIAALTVQDTSGVQGIWEVPADFVKEQIVAVLTDMGADAVKIGMVGSGENIQAVVDALRGRQIGPLVVDPVMVSKNRVRLLDEGAIDPLKEQLLPMAHVVTPNLEEASALCGLPIHSLDEMELAAMKIHELGPRWVLITGGHLKDRAVDLLFDGRNFYRLDGPKLRSSPHGTGCVFSSALATFLALGLAVPAAADKAKAFVRRAISSCIKMGRGLPIVNPQVNMTVWEERHSVLKSLRAATERLLLEPIGGLIPEVRSNLGYAPSSASTVEEVAAIPGRISQVGERPIASLEPAFGASKHIAKVILAAMKKNPSLRSAMNIRFGHDVLSACEGLGFVVAGFDRTLEPQDIKEKEGSSLEWGTLQAFNSSAPKIPDIIYDLGDIGKEPMVRVLGRTPMEVVEKILKIQQRLQEHQAVRSVGARGTSSR